MNSIRSLAARLIAAAFLVTPSLAAAQGAQPDLARGEELFSLCAKCHGDAAEGKQNIGAPAIAGLPAWYVKEQLRKFSVGLRGKHFDDAEGLRMRPMSLWLTAGRHASGELEKERAAFVAEGRPEKLDPNIENVAAFVASLPATNPAATVTGGDLANGEANWALCGSCHGMRGEGSEPQSAPPLAGQSDWYLLSSLKKYKAMTRGYDGPNDPFGATMAGMSNVLADEQAMKDVVAFSSTLKK